MKKYTYKFNKSANYVIKEINNEINRNGFVGYIEGNHIELRRICEGYNNPTSYQLTADITSVNNQNCTLIGSFRYKTSWIITALIMAVIIFGYSSFMATVYNSSIGKYLLVFSTVVSLSYLIMTFSKRKTVVSQTEKLFDEINEKKP